ncbi:hypothetical protein HDU98_000607 [Podochytrium sp. JEL0797]|nr:hypothetical protein HDU98_000607 [Podochytrium sp. JEL0797]
MAAIRPPVVDLTDSPPVSHYAVGPFASSGVIDLCSSSDSDEDEVALIPPRKRIKPVAAPENLLSPKGKDPVNEDRICLDLPIHNPKLTVDGLSPAGQPSSSNTVASASHALLKVGAAPAAGVGGSSSTPIPLLKPLPKFDFARDVKLDGEFSRKIHSTPIHEPRPLFKHPMPLVGGGGSISSKPGSDGPNGGSSSALDFLSVRQRTQVYDDMLNDIMGGSSRSSASTPENVESRSLKRKVESGGGLDSLLALLAFVCSFLTLRFPYWFPPAGGSSSSGNKSLIPSLQLPNFSPAGGSSYSGSIKPPLKPIKLKLGAPPLSDPNVSAKLGGADNVVSGGASSHVLRMFESAMAAADVVTRSNAGDPSSGTVGDFSPVNKPKQVEKGESVDNQPPVARKIAVPRTMHQAAVVAAVAAAIPSNAGGPSSRAGRLFPLPKPRVSAPLPAAASSPTSASAVAKKSRANDVPPDMKKYEDLLRDVMMEDAGARGGGLNGNIPVAKKRTRDAVLEDDIPAAGPSTANNPHNLRPHRSYPLAKLKPPVIPSPPPPAAKKGPKPKPKSTPPPAAKPSSSSSRRKLSATPPPAVPAPPAPKKKQPLVPAVNKHAGNAEKARKEKKEKERLEREKAQKERREAVRLQQQQGGPSVAPVPIVGQPVPRTPARNHALPPLPVAPPRLPVAGDALDPRMEGVRRILAGADAQRMQQQRQLQEQLNLLAAWPPPPALTAEQQQALQNEQVARYRDREEYMNDHPEYLAAARRLNAAQTPEEKAASLEEYRKANIELSARLAVLADARRLNRLAAGVAPLPFAGAGLGALRQGDLGAYFKPAAAMAAPQPLPAVDENPDDNCPVCNVKLVTMPQLAQEKHLRICLGDEQSSPTKEVPTAKVIGTTWVVSKCRESLGDRECTICMDEFEVGVPMATMNCWCVYHESCIKDWFSKKKSCPTHASD